MAIVVIEFAAGVLVGGMIGALLMACCIVAGRADDRLGV